MSEEIITYNQEIIYIPIIVQWVEDGKTEQRKVNIENGLTIKLQQSEKDYTACNTENGESVVWEMEKEDAYNVLGISHANEDGFTKDGTYTYVLDSEDIELAKQASNRKLVLWIGSGGQFVKANKIVNENNHSGLKIIHKGINKEGKKGNFEILFLIPIKE